MEIFDQIYIGGGWVDSSSSEVIEVENPATEEIVRTVPAGTREDVLKAVASAKSAFESWQFSTVGERKELLTRISAGIARRSDELATAISVEVGSPVRIAGPIQAGLPKTVVDSYATLLDSFEFEHKVGNSLVVREAAGVVGAITPWNYPLHQIVCKVAPALAAGCTVVLKPSELAPTVAYLFADILHEAGVPAGVFNLVSGHGAAVGEAIAGHPDLDLVSFTGSVNVGKRVGELAAANITRSALELGGKSASVVLPDADLAKAVKVSVHNAFLNGGQTCMAWTRMLVHADQYDEAIEIAASVAALYQPGDPLDPATRLGPMSSAAQRGRVETLLGVALDEGARVVAGGPGRPADQARGHYVSATVLADVRPDSTIAQEEVFGPVLSMIAYDDEEDALRIANNSAYGLAGAVWSADERRAIDFARRVRTGQMDVNGGRFNPIAPFGGYKKSGTGRELGAAGLEEFLETKAIQL
ncbi:aldehyde dehydrogenase family protein [Rhodococcoides yunnanense]|uniref:aldehyde dehydrogenase family protein n=1 Tax=Rhodococcoides yunnanense TaxID=278209 RepID=UPI000933C520|nr:aldehyde dehydrogenase family protein [Rhodococcus yunnanensis]